MSEPRRPDPVDPEARNAKVRHDNDLSTTSSTTSTTSTSSTPDERLLRYFLSESEVSPDPMCDPNPNPYTIYMRIL